MKFNKKLAIAVSGAVLLMAGQIALADSTTDIVDALVGKGVLTEEEGKLITKGHVSKTEKTPVIKEKDGAFSLSSPNGKNSIQLTGRMHFDTKVSDVNQGDLLSSTGNVSNADTDSRSMGDHFNMRRARLGVKGRIGGIADYESVFNIVGSKMIDVVYIDINKYEPLGLKFGMFKQPINLEIKTSSNNIDMIERSYISQNAPEKRLGAELHGEITGITYAGSIFQNNDSALSMTDNKIATAGRATLNLAELWNNKDMVMHAGLNGFSSNYQLQAAQTTNGDSSSTTPRATLFGFSAGGQGIANAYRAQIADTAASATGPGAAAPRAANAHADNFGIEGIFAYNNFKLQGEYSSAFYKASSTIGDSLEADVDTWYAGAYWILTGEKYADSYKKGAFGSLKPKNEFNLDSGTGMGLWELGIRMDAFDVSNTSLTTTSAGNTRFQGSVDTLTNRAGAYGWDTCGASYGSAAHSSNGAGCGGGAKSYTASVKWIWNPNFLFKANYVYTKFDNAFSPIDIGADAARSAGVNRISDESLLMMRGQYMF